MGPAVPNATSRVMIVAPMLRELVNALGYAAKSKGAAGLAMATLIGFGTMAATTLTSGTTTLLDDRFQNSNHKGPSENAAVSCT
jgi:hypothetical protein